jgi:hypothetical protein
MVRIRRKATYDSLLAAISHSMGILGRRAASQTLQVFSICSDLNFFQNTTH